MLVATTGIHTHTHTHTHVQTHTHTHTHRKDTSKTNMQSCVHVLDCGNHGQMRDNDDQRPGEYSAEALSPTGSRKNPAAMQGMVSVPCIEEDCGNRAGAGAHEVGTSCTGVSKCIGDFCTPDPGLQKSPIYIEPPMSGGERAEPFPTGSGKIPPAMQGEVSVPCMYQDCGNRAGAGAHVVGGLLHGQPGMACQASGCPTTWGGERAEHS